MSVKTLDKIQDIKIAYIGGGSRGWAWGLMADLALEPQMSGEVRLYDIDYAAAYANEIIGNGLTKNPKTCSTWNYKAVKSLEAALCGADFVVISILPGTMDEMESDVHLPEKYGIYQSVGDTVGPGGIVRAMRTIPMYVEIAEAIKAYSPSAWVINYTNPMTVCVGTLHRVFPEIKVFGCCHEVFSTQQLMAKILEIKFGIPHVGRDEIRLNVLGINHFTWFDKISYQSMDLLPIYKSFVDEYAETGFGTEESDYDTKNTFRSMNKVSFDLYKRFNMVSISGDRHIAEFLPPWYLKDPETVEKWGFALTPVSNRKAEREKLLARSKKYVSGAEAFELEPSGEEGTKQIKALLGLSDMFTNVNMPNKGQIKNLPHDAVVETNAVIGKDFAQPVISGGLPDHVNTLVYKHAMNQQMLVKAGMERDIELAFAVFLNDSLMTLDISEAEKLFGEMLENTKEYLPGWDIGKYAK